MIWATSAVIVVVIAVDRAPLHTFGDWAWLAFVIALATGMPLLLVLSMHHLALTGVGRFLAYLAVTTIVLILLWFFVAGAGLVRGGRLGISRLQ